MKAILMIAATVIAATPLVAAASTPTQQARVCTTLGKVHAQRDRQIYPVTFQSLDGHLTTHIGEACFMLDAGQHVLGLTARTEFAAFPFRRLPKGSLKEQQLPILVEPRRTYTVGAQIDDRYQASWIPMLQSVELWDQGGHE